MSFIISCCILLVYIFSWFHLYIFTAPNISLQIPEKENLKKSPICTSAVSSSGSSKTSSTGKSEKFASLASHVRTENMIWPKTSPFGGELVSGNYHLQGSWERCPKTWWNSCRPYISYLCKCKRYPLEGQLILRHIRIEPCSGYMFSSLPPKTANGCWWKTLSSLRNLQTLV